jgi:hypothetical protein
VIFLKELYSSPSLVIYAGYINQEKNRTSQNKTPSISYGQKVMLFFKAMTPNLLFTLRTYGQRYFHVIGNLFCVTSSPVGPIITINDKLSESAIQKINQMDPEDVR